MAALIIALAFIALFLGAGFVSARDMRPDRRPPEWSVGGLIGPRH
jgi:hypothetical protein